MTDIIFLPLAQVVPETLLAEDLRDEAGRLLVLAETPLTSILLSNLAQRGINSVGVRLGPQASAPGPLTPVQQAALDAHLEQLFRFVGETEAGACLRAILRQYRLQTCWRPAVGGHP